jgi:hypothetical protein
MWIEQTKDTRLPDWLSENLSSKCKYCDSPMLDYYNDADGRCTGRKCSNEYCPGMIAARADNMRQLIGIKGVGFAACLELVNRYDVKDPIQLLSYWDIKPTVKIGTYLRMHCWAGVDTELETEMQRYGIHTMDDLFTKYDGKYKQLIQQHAEELKAYVHLVNLELPDVIVNEPKIVHTIMITGTPNGFSTKEDFINQVNAACGGYIVTIHQKTKRQSGVDFLIREQGSTTRGKVEAAIRGGIPIVTSVEYIQVLSKEMSTIKGGK